MNMLYQVIGISKQAVHQYDKRQAIFDEQVRQLILEADELRAEHPGCGVEKMHYTLAPDFIGRDRFVALMMQLGYRLKRKKNYKRTTITSKVYYPNLIKGMPVVAPSIVWQSDITYILIGELYYYAVFIIDVYTKKVVGYQVSEHMRATANLAALKMALKDHKAPKFHHSDRGSQYTYNEYVDTLKALGCKLSMCVSAQDNAYAERINRTIKEEYLDHWKPISFQQLKRCTKKAVNHYNKDRPHDNIYRMSPLTFENYWERLTPEQRPITTIFNNEINV
ncbi:IS3 family transposase [Catalinimonas niigatensis]|uniref:IS3 family transposase n=1 Tax=Catalinimonas niigatensis TaxID=1397264 RepID=UPI002666F09E|nr:IS3 family transposase [Catalinimonas niigatensis]WPP49585.1 IS3 family transposase [Catalinimonas niigatensis]WPP50052.1 IS3 family transposase [Catalinimonas niigatensis]WPP50780.1 IS3 family transposase [Catalinimonas niigatensis]WPP53050.1 IS3 family transposase [Catalinimonas niigatensis]